MAAWGTASHCRSSAIVGFAAERSLEFFVADGVGGNVGVALEDLERVLKRGQDFAEGLAALGDVAGLAEGAGERLVLVDLAVELELQLVLRRAHQEVADGLGNGVSN